MKIDNAHLAAFSAVIQHGTFERAARMLNVTPSAVSQRIKLLEERLGQILLLRASPCEPTATGKALLRFSTQLDLLENELLADLGGQDESALAGAGIRIPVAVNADSLDGWFLRAFEETCRDGRICLDVRVEDQEFSAVMLREGSVMAAVSASNVAIQGCRVEYLGDMRYQALASPDFVNRFFKMGLDPVSLTRAPMLVFNRKDGLQQQFIRRLTHEEIIPPVNYLPSTRGFIDVARRGLGWGMIPQYMASSELARGELVEIAPGQHFDVPLYWHHWRFSSKALEKLGAAVREAAKGGLCIDSGRMQGD
jgi:LysR family transcriptional regulator (chromosome initiation inhibitor)